MHEFHILCINVLDICDYYYEGLECCTSCFILVLRCHYFSLVNTQSFLGSCRNYIFCTENLPLQLIYFYVERPLLCWVLFMLRKLVQCTIRERGRKEFSVAISNLSLLSDLMLKATFLNLAEENRKCCVSTSHIECKLSQLCSKTFFQL